MQKENWKTHYSCTVTLIFIRIVYILFNFCLLIFGFIGWRQAVSNKSPTLSLERLLSPTLHCFLLSLNIFSPLLWLAFLFSLTRGFLAFLRNFRFNVAVCRIVDQQVVSFLHLLVLLS